MTVARRGFTLMEVLAALVLLGVVLPVAMRSATLSLRVAARARHESEAAMLAETRVNELLAQGDSSLLSGAGDFGEDWPEYRWLVTSSAREYGCYEFTVTVTWQERSGERSVAATSLLYPDARGVP